MPTTQNVNLRHQYWVARAVLSQLKRLQSVKKNKTIGAELASFFKGLFQTETDNRVGTSFRPPFTLLADMFSTETLQQSFSRSSRRWGRHPNLILNSSELLDLKALVDDLEAKTRQLETQFNSTDRVEAESVEQALVNFARGEEENSSAALQDREAVFHPIKHMTLEETVRALEVEALEVSSAESTVSQYCEWAQQVKQTLASVESSVKARFEECNLPYESSALFSHFQMLEESRAKIQANQGSQEEHITDFKNRLSDIKKGLEVRVADVKYPAKKEGGFTTLEEQTALSYLKAQVETFRQEKQLDINTLSFLRSPRFRQMLRKKPNVNDGQPILDELNKLPNVWGIDKLNISNDTTALQALDALVGHQKLKDIKPFSNSPLISRRNFNQLQEAVVKGEPLTVDKVSSLFNKASEVKAEQVDSVLADEDWKAVKQAYVQYLSEQKQPGKVKDALAHALANSSASGEEGYASTTSSALVVQLTPKEDSLIDVIGKMEKVEALWYTSQAELPLLVAMRLGEESKVDEAIEQYHHQLSKGNPTEHCRAQVLRWQRLYTSCCGFGEDKARKEAFCKVAKRYFLLKGQDEAQADEAVLEMYELYQKENSSQEEKVARLQRLSAPSVNAVWDQAVGFGLGELTLAHQLVLRGVAPNLPEARKLQATWLDVLKERLACFTGQNNQMLRAYLNTFNWQDKAAFQKQFIYHWQRGKEGQETALALEARSLFENRVLPEVERNNKSKAQSQLDRVIKIYQHSCEHFGIKPKQAFMDGLRSALKGQLAYEHAGVVLGIESRPSSQMGESQFNREQAGRYQLDWVKEARQTGEREGCVYAIQEGKVDKSEPVLKVRQQGHQLTFSTFEFYKQDGSVDEASVHIAFNLLRAQFGNKATVSFPPGLGFKVEQAFEQAAQAYRAQHPGASFKFISHQKYMQMTNLSRFAKSIQKTSPGARAASSTVAKGQNSAGANNEGKIPTPLAEQLLNENSNWANHSPEGPVPSAPTKEVELSPVSPNS